MLGARYSHIQDILKVAVLLLMSWIVFVSRLYNSIDGRIVAWVTGSVLIDANTAQSPSLEKAGSMYLGTRDITLVLLEEEMTDWSGVAVE